MSIITSIKEHLMGGWLRRFLSRENLKQPSTIKAMIRMAVAAGVITLSPETQDAVVTLVLQVIAAGELAKGVIDAVRNERPKPPPPAAEELPWRAKPKPKTKRRVRK